MRRKRRPTYFQCKRVIDRLYRLQDLIRHHQPSSHEIVFARPIDRLLPKGVKKEHEYQSIEHEIAGLLQLAHSYLLAVGVETEIVKEEPEIDIGDGLKRKKIERKLDLIGNYFALERMGDPRVFDTVLRTLGAGIGVYEVMKRTAFWNLFNPLAWIAGLFRIPVTIMERAAMPDKADASWAVKIFGWAAGGLVLLILAFCAIRLGYSLDWQDLIGKITGGRITAVPSAPTRTSSASRADKPPADKR